MQPPLQDILRFVRLLNAFRRVERVVLSSGEERWENDVEHSYQLAMLAWFLLSTSKSPLDTNKVLQYALIHDLVEVYAGDTYIFSQDEGHTGSKQERERLAALRLKEEFPDFEDLHVLIEEYEKMDSPESRFVYALDKIQPMLNIYDDGGRSWRKTGVTIEMLIEKKTDKVALSPEVKEYFDVIIETLKTEEKVLFG